MLMKRHFPWRLNSCDLVLVRKFGASLQVGLQVGELLEEAFRILNEAGSDQSESRQLCFSLAGTQEVVVDELKDTEIGYCKVVPYEELSSMFNKPFLQYLQLPTASVFYLRLPI